MLKEREGNMRNVVSDSFIEGSQAIFLRGNFFLTEKGLVAQMESITENRSSFFACFWCQEALVHCSCSVSLFLSPGKLLFFSFLSLNLIIFYVFILFLSIIQSHRTHVQSILQINIHTYKISLSLSIYIYIYKEKQ